MNPLITELRRLLGERHVLTAAADVAPYCTDWRGRYTGSALGVALPGSTEEVAVVVRACVAASTAIVPQGGNTGLCGGATPVGGADLDHQDGRADGAGEDEKGGEEHAPDCARIVPSCGTQENRKGDRISRVSFRPTGRN